MHLRRIADSALRGIAGIVGVGIATIVFAAPPPLAADLAPPGVWTLVALDGAPDPRPGPTVQLGIADDGTTVLVDTGCERFLAVAVRHGRTARLERRDGSELPCTDDRAEASRIVGSVLASIEAWDVVAGRLRIQGAGHVLSYAPDAGPVPSGIPGVPDLASRDRLDSSRFASVVRTSASNGAHWVLDPLSVALLFVDEASTGDTTVVREDLGQDDATSVRLWFDRLRDDAVRARWYELHLERDGDGVWMVTAAWRALQCARGSATGVLVAGVCP